MTIEEEGLDNALNVILSRFLMWFLILEECEWKENWSEKELMRWFPGLNSLSKKEKKRWSLLHLLFMSMSVDFRHSLCLRLMLSMEILWGLCLYNPLELRILLIMWLGGSDDPLKRNLLYNFLRWRCIGMRPEMASIPAIGDVQKVPDI